MTSLHTRLPAYLDFIDYLRANADERTICITPTGWVNALDYSQSHARNYMVAYSLHSNFSELEMFVKSV